MYVASFIMDQVCDVLSILVKPPGKTTRADLVPGITRNQLKQIYIMAAL